MTEPMTPEELEDAARYVAFGESTFDQAFAEERNLPLLRRLLDENARLNAQLDSQREVWKAELDSVTAQRDTYKEAVYLEGNTIEALSARLTAKNAELDKTIQGMLNAGAEWAEKIGAMRAERDEAIREAAADKAKLAAVRKIKAQRRNSAMVTSEQLATMHGWNDAVNAIREALEPCECGMTDPSTWEMHGGATEPGSAYEWNPDCPAHGDAPDAAPEMLRPPAEEAAWSDADRVCAFDGCGESCRHDEENPVPPAQEPVSGPETPGTGSGRGTGVAEAPGTAQVDDDV